MSKRFFKLIKILLSNRIVISFLSVVITFIVLNILSGLIGNIAYSGTPPWFKPAWDFIRTFVNANILTIVTIILLLSLFALGMVSYHLRNLKNTFDATNRALTATDSLVGLDDSLLRLLTNLVADHTSKSKDDLRNEVRKLLHELLRDAIRTVLGDKDRGRAMVLLPEDASATYLKAIAYHRISFTSANRTRFYIGNDETKDFERGTVGMVYVEQRIRVRNMIQKDGRWECNDGNYINFDESRIHPPYVTFVNVPIFSPSRGGKVTCIGVLCLDSNVEGAFDSQQTQTLLEAICRRIAGVISIYLEVLP